MLKGVTKRQIIVLYVLVALLVVILGVRYAILPMMESNNEKSAELNEIMSRYDNYVFDGQQAQTYDELNRQLETDIENISRSFQSDIKTSNIDAKISELIKTSGLSAVSLTVNEPIDVTKDSLKEDSADTQAQTQVQQKKSESSSNVRSITADVTTSGSYDELVRFIGLVEQQEAMYMTDLTFAMKVDGNDLENEITMNFSVVSFVYAPQAENNNNQSEEVTQAAS